MSDHMVLTLSKASSTNLVGPGLIQVGKHQIQLSLPGTVDMTNGDYEVTLDSLSIPKSWFNVSSTYSNNTFSYIWPGDNLTYTVTIASGNYTISDLNAYLQQSMLSRGHYLLHTDDTTQVQSYVYFISLVFNTTYYTTTLTCTPVPSELATGYTNPSGTTLPSTPTTCQLILPTNAASNQETIANILGFGTGTYPPAPQSTIYQINGSSTPGSSSPTDPVQLICANCSLISTNSFNTFPSSLWTFSPNSVAFGGVIFVQLAQKSWFPCLPVNTIANPRHQHLLYDPIAAKMNQQRFQTRRHMIGGRIVYTHVSRVHGGTLKLARHLGKKVIVAHKSQPAVMPQVKVHVNSTPPFRPEPRPMISSVGTAFGKVQGGRKQAIFDGDDLLSKIHKAFASRRS